MKDSTHLKLLLEQIKENEYKVPENNNLMELVSDMLCHIGDVDPILRDELIYQTFSKWIINETLDDVQLKYMAGILVDEQHLFFDIGDQNSDSVFTRSFSVLVMALIIYRHRNRKIFEHSELIGIYDSVMTYFDKEVDMRGYVHGKGWAHSVAHTADALDELALCKELGINELQAILEQIKKKLYNTILFINEEDERLAIAVGSILDRDMLSRDDLVTWLDTFITEDKTVNIVDGNVIYINVKNFIRSLYFRVLDRKDKDLYLEAIKNVHDRISHYA